MNNTIIRPRYKTGLFLLAASLIAMSLPAQNKTQKSPPFKSIRTTVHQAVQKNTSWTPGAIVDQIHFVKYNRYGQKIAENSLKPDGSADSKIVFIYDEDGNVEKEIVASIKQGGVSNIFEYHYDAQGRVDGKKKMDAQQEIMSVDTILRNEAGQVEKRIYYGINIMGDKKKLPFRETISINYNEQGQITEVIEESTLNKNTGSGKRELAKSDTLPLKRYSEGAFKRYNAPQSKRVDMEYDTYGNWIKRVEYNGPNPEYILVRHIEYAGPEDTDRKVLLLQGKVKSVHQTSYIAAPLGTEIINRGPKSGTFFIYQFDKEGRKTMASHFSNTGVPEGTTEYSYNANGDIEKEIRKSPAGKMESTTVWTYNDDGNVRIKSMTDANGEPMRKTFFRYNTEGSCTQEICFYKDGSTYSEFHYQHDPYGNLISKKVVKAPAEAPGEEYESIDRVWNARGRIVEEKIGTPPNERQYSYQYSSRGEVISGTESISGQPAVKFVYKFYNDPHGNWKKRIKFINEKAVLYEEREYTYYN